MRQHMPSPVFTQCITGSGLRPICNSVERFGDVRVRATSPRCWDNRSLLSDQYWFRTNRKHEYTQRLHSCIYYWAPMTWKALHWTKTVIRMYENIQRNTTHKRDAIQHAANHWSVSYDHSLKWCIRFDNMNWILQTNPSTWQTITRNHLC